MVFLHKFLNLFPYVTGADIGSNGMEFFYWFKNVSLTQRVLKYLNHKWRSHLEQTTVIVLNAHWVIRVKLDSVLGSVHYKDCPALYCTAL
ncbi:MAG: hypothetical protein AAF327_24340 [Cyanobacteria bacterium P01_A01_bin.37]